MVHYSRAYGAERSSLPIDDQVDDLASRLAIFEALDASADGLGPPAAALEDDLAPSPADVDAAQILRDRPDVFAAYYRDFYGPGNDRSSSAWVDRVGGETPEDYARYWYETHGRFEGYAPSPGPARAPSQVGAEGPAVRTTVDGIPISTILRDRPDVFQAFFTEFYGPNNDRHSDAWVQRVGGATVEDYADYWYNAHGRVEGYRPSAPQADARPDPVAAPIDPAIEERAPLQSEDPSLDPWNHPAIYPDWGPPGGPATQPALDPGISADDYPFARPLVALYTEDGVELLPATLAEIEAMRTLFDDTAF